MKRIQIASALALTVCLAASCNGSGNYDPFGQSGKIGFKISEVDEVLTKGSIVTTNSINQDNQTFVVNAWLGSLNRYQNDKDGQRTYDEGGSTGRMNFSGDETDYHFIKDAAVTYKSGDWFFGTEDAKNPHVWRNAVPTTFWSYYPAALTNGTRTITLPGDLAEDAAQNDLSFTYAIPNGTDSAVKQEDLLFAYNLQHADFEETWGEENYGKLINGTSTIVNIHFYHALAAIRFDVSGAISQGRAITNIELGGLRASATCDVTGSGDSPGAVSFNWYNAKGTASCSQTFSASDFTEKSLDGTTPNALMSKSSGKFFFVIPQQVKNSVTLTITVDGETQQKVLDHDTPWEAGKIYTYKLNPGTASEELEVQLIVEDWIKGGNEIAL